MSEDTTKLLDSNGDRIERLIQMVAGLVSDVAEIKTRLTALEQRVESLEQKVEERLYDTRPIWESVQAQITELREGQEKIVSEVRALRIAFGRSYGDMLTTQEEHEIRISKLEGKQ
ncbi:MAG: hypothetical protein AB1631_24635 [Acidobacteriota bacterium]